MWPFVFGVFLILGTLAGRGSRWAYFTFVMLGLLFFPERVGFAFHPRPCESELSLPLALFSLTNYKHIVLFCIFFLLTAIQARNHSAGAQFLIASGAVLAMGVYVEVAEGLTGQGHCRVRDLVPDAAGALLGAIVWTSWRKLKPSIIAFCLASTLCGLRAQAAVWQPSPGHTQMPIWPGEPPHKQQVETVTRTGSDHLVAGRPWTYVTNAADQVSFRPDFAMAIYPGRLFDHEKLALNSDLHVTHDTPPTFLLHAENDNVDGVSHSLIYYDTLKNAGVPRNCICTRKGGTHSDCGEPGFRSWHGLGWPKRGCGRSE